MQFEINTPDNKTLTIEAVDAVAAVPVILALLGLRGDELMLDLNDWRGHEWFTGQRERK